MNTLESIADLLGVSLPRKHLLKDLNIYSLDQVLAFVEESSKDKTLGEFPEGWVLYVNGTPIAKIKNSLYVNLHHIGGGDTAHTKNVVIEAFFNASIDDMMKVLTDPMVAYVEALRKWYIAKSAEVMADYRSISEGTYADQKAYALRVQKIADKGLMALFFAEKEKVIGKTFSQEDINSFFKKAWQKYEKELKAL